MKSICCLVLCFLAVGFCAKELPSYVPLCKRTSPMFNDCIKMATITLQPYLAKGIKELNVPALEPLEIPMVKLEQGTGAVNYKATLTKIKVHGLSNYNFENIQVSFAKGIAIKGKALLPRIGLNSEYNIGGKILLLPIQGDGDFSANITNCIADFVATGDIVKKKGVEYFQVKDTKLNIKVNGQAMIHFDNLFNGDPVLSMTTNNFLNENAKDILNEIKPAIEAVAAMLIDDIVNKVFASTSQDKLFPK